MEDVQTYTPPPPTPCLDKATPLPHHQDLMTCSSDGGSLQTPEAGLAVYVDEEGLREKLGGRWWWTRLASWLRPSDLVLASIPLKNVVSSSSITADAKLGPFYKQLLDTGGGWNECWPSSCWLGMDDETHNRSFGSSFSYRLLD